MDEPVGFSARCPTCGADLHACVNCRFYAPGRYRDCSENVDSTVTDKRSRSYCEWFQPGPAMLQEGSGRDKAKADKARSQLGKLFGD